MSRVHANKSVNGLVIPAVGRHTAFCLDRNRTAMFRTLCRSKYVMRNHWQVSNFRLSVQRNHPGELSDCQIWRVCCCGGGRSSIRTVVHPAVVGMRLGMRGGRFRSIVAIYDIVFFVCVVFPVIAHNVVSPVNWFFWHVTFIQSMAWFEEPSTQGCIKFVIWGEITWTSRGAESCSEALLESTPVSRTLLGELWP